MGESGDDLAEQNRILRERISELEKAGALHVDPVLRALVQNLPEFLNVIAPDGRFLAQSRSSAGFGEILGRSVFDFVEPQYVEVMRETFARVCATGQTAHYEAVGFGETGEPGHSYFVRAVPLREDGQVKSILVVPTDITERVRLERSLKESEQALRTAVRASRIGLWRWDLATGEMRGDARMLEILHVEEAPERFDAFLELVHPEDRARVTEAARLAAETGTLSNLEYRILPGSDSGDRWVLSAGGVLADASAQTSTLIGGTLDITDQKRLAAHIQRAERVQSIGQLAAGLAHNFNNLLAAIVPNLDFAIPRVDGSEKAALSAALDAALQARDLVRTLLSLASRRGTQVHESADPKVVVERVQALCHATFPREIELTSTVDPHVGYAAISPTHLEQVLLNLLFNARDALEAATGPVRRIQIVVERMERGGARLRVVDTGGGMPPEVRKRVFEPFFTTKSPHKGSGLGLANALARVRECGGSIDFESVVGSGTTFTIELPEGKRSVSGSPARKAPARGRGQVVLVIDDEPLVRGGLRIVLEAERYRVLEAASAEEARAHLSREPGRVELMILDHSMPGESGLEALASLRALSNAPIVLFTGYAPELTADLDAVLEKPARPEELFNVIERLLSKTTTP